MNREDRFISRMLLPLSYQITTETARRAVRERFHDKAPLEIQPLIDFAFDLFHGKYPGFQPCDTAFHDFDHTMQATEAVLDLLIAHGTKPIIADLSARDWELSAAAILLHDSGYLKNSNDRDGSGAKYSAIHVARSCFFAWDLLPEFGFTADELRQIQNAICGTAIATSLNDLPLRSPREWLISAIVASGDMLGQMAADDYPERLAGLYLEFREASEFSRFKQTRFAVYSSLLDLLCSSEKFFYTYALPMLEKDWKGVYHIMDDERGDNRYLSRIKKNLNRVNVMARSLGAFNERRADRRE
jgi:hypothetical protein